MLLGKDFFLWPIPWPSPVKKKNPWRNSNLKKGKNQIQHCYLTISLISPTSLIGLGFKLGLNQTLCLFYSPSSKEGCTVSCPHSWLHFSGSPALVAWGSVGCCQLLAFDRRWLNLFFKRITQGIMARERIWIPQLKNMHSHSRFPCAPRCINEDFPLTLTSQLLGQMSRLPRAYCLCTSLVPCPLKIQPVAHWLPGLQTLSTGIWKCFG